MAKYARTFIILEGIVPEEWASTDGKQRVIDAMQELFDVYGSGTGVAGVILNAIYIRTENGDILSPTINKLRKDYPLQLEQGCPDCQAPEPSMYPAISGKCDNEFHNWLRKKPEPKPEPPQDTPGWYAEQLHSLQQWLANNDPTRGDYKEDEVVPRVIEILGAPLKCTTCGSPDPDVFPAGVTRAEGVGICDDAFHVGPERLDKYIKGVRYMTGAQPVNAKRADVTIPKFTGPEKVELQLLKRVADYCAQNAGGDPLRAAAMFTEICGTEVVEE